jgi:hypothetical protein
MGGSPRSNHGDATCVNGELLADQNCATVASTSITAAIAASKNPYFMRVFSRAPQNARQISNILKLNV